MNIKEYMREIYMRVLYTLFSVIITCICAYAYTAQLIYILAAPLEEAHNARNEIFCASHNMTGEEFHFIFTEITEAFMAATQLSMFMALYLQFPIILYQVWLFIKPGLYQYESKWLSTIMLISCNLTVINLIITYFIILPATCKFFLSFEMSGADAIQYGIKIHLEAKIYTYLSLVEKACFAGHLFFQIPTMIILCIRL